MDNPVCVGLGNLGLSCDAPVFVVTLWHLVFGLLIFLAAFIIVRSVQRHRGIQDKSILIEMVAPYAACPDSDTIRIHPHEFAKALGERGYETFTKTVVAEKLNEKYGERYFAVEVREQGNRIFSKELRIVPWPRSLEKTEFQVDPSTLRDLKIASASKLDDDTSDRVGLDGRFDILFRPVRWWDFRHWLNHPAREIRYAVYVAIFAALLEYSSDIIEPIRAIA